MKGLKMFVSKKRRAFEEFVLSQKYAVNTIYM